MLVEGILELNFKGDYMKTNFYLQYSGKQIADSDIVATAKDHWKESGNLIKNIKILDIYVKPEEGKAYYTINDDFSGDISL